MTHPIFRVYRCSLNPADFFRARYRKHDDPAVINRISTRKITGARSAADWGWCEMGGYLMPRDRRSGVLDSLMHTMFDIVEFVAISLQESQSMQPRRCLVQAATVTLCSILHPSQFFTDCYKRNRQPERQPQIRHLARYIDTDRNR